MSMRTWVSAIPADCRRLIRDDLLGWMAGVPVVMALTARLAASSVDEAFLQVGVQPQVWRPIGDVLLFVITIPLIMGTVVGFMLLDEKDEHTLLAIAITPVSLRGYLVWRAGLAMVFSFVMILVALPLGGLTGMNAVRVVLIAAVSAPLAGVAALALGAFAANKVQGFAGVKLALVVCFLPTFSAVTEAAWTKVFIIVPSYLPVQAYLALDSGWIWLCYAAAGLGYDMVLMVWAIRHLEHQM